MGRKSPLLEMMPEGTDGPDYLKINIESGGIEVLQNVDGRCLLIGWSSLSGDVYEKPRERKTGDSHVSTKMDRTPRLRMASSFLAAQQVNILWHTVTRLTYGYLADT